MFSKKFQIFAIVGKFVLQFVKRNKVNVKHALVFFRFHMKVKSCMAFSLFNWKFFSIATYAQAGKGILFFPNIPYTSLVNSRYETLRKKLKKKTKKKNS